MGYVQVKHNFTPPASFLTDDESCKASNPSTKGWCTPLQIKFTTYAKSPNLYWQKGYEWGLRLYVLGFDAGIIFSIKLLKEPLYHAQPVPMGPNPVLVPRPVPPKGIDQDTTHAPSLKGTSLA